MIIITDNKLESTAFAKRDEIIKLRIVKIVMVKNENDARISKDFLKKCSENCIAYRIKKVNMNKRYGYFEHDADIGIIGRGNSLEEAFESAAVAMFSIMVDVDVLHCHELIEVKFEEEDNEFALIEWLNTLLAVAHTKHLVLGRFELHKEGSYWSGKAWGEKWKKEFERGTEVKGATLTMLSVQEKEDHWLAQCVVDV